MWKFRRFYDQGDAGAPAAPVTPVAAPATAPVAASTAPATDTIPGMADFRERTNREISRWRQDSALKDAAPVGTPADRQLSPDLVGGRNQTLATPTSELVQKPVETPAAPPAPAVPAVEPTPAAPEPSPAEQKLLKLCGSDWTIEQAEQHIRYAHEASQKIADIMKREADISAAESAPEMVLIKELQTNADLRQKVLELMNTDAPGVATNIKVEETNAQMAAMKAEIEALKAAAAQRQQAEQQRAEQLQREEAERVSNATITQVRTALGAEAAKIGLPENFLNYVGSTLVQRVQNRQVAFEPNALIAEGQKIIAELAQFANQRVDQTRQQYLDKKSQHPPAPPVGGGSPSVMPAPAKTWRDANARTVQRVSNALNNLGGGK